ncbi:DMT family transporter [Kaustia mangrovi]|uniref:DMT family transporter n=1 Tax=Kaustia mangrovi TaxID=2593653 RepID=A0A7S8C3P5_9HYPH|nr:DMT family transporter [Kaustia mangrovi]QPC42776.1 DMT family transporter [Kaustia mangrovi]
MACALAVVALFSGFTIVSRLGLTSAMPVPDLGVLRFGIGGLILTPVLLHHGLGGVPLPKALLLALLGGLGFALLAYSGFALAPAAHGAVLLHGTLPLSTFVLVMLLDPAQSRRATTSGLALIAVGVALMAWDSLRTASAQQLLGDAFLLLASFCWSAYGVMARRLGLPPLQAASIVAVLSMLCFLPPYIAFHGATLVDHDWQALLVQGVYQGILIGVGSIFVYTLAVNNLGASETALFTAAVPGVTTLGAIALLAEWPSPAEWAGVALATIGMLFAIRTLYTKQETKP